MIARVWRTGIDPERAAEYDVFAAERSLPMFRRQDGIRAGQEFEIERLERGAYRLVRKEAAAATALRRAIGRA